MISGKRVHDATMHVVLGTTTAVHRLVHRVSGGRWGRRFPGGVQVVWVTARGARSGVWRTVPLLSVADATHDGPGERPWVVAGSNTGQDRVPAWVGNLRADPDCRLEVDGRHWTARAEEVTGPERDALYAQLVAVWPSYAGYERRTGRTIPVFRVHPVRELDPGEVPDGR